MKERREKDSNWNVLAWEKCLYDLREYILGGGNGIQETQLLEIICSLK